MRHHLKRTDEAIPYPTRPISVRLPESEIARLNERAGRLSGTPSALARELIVTGLADSDQTTQSERLLKIERRLAAISQDIVAVVQSSEKQGRAISNIEDMFHQLLHALAGYPVGEDGRHVRR